MMFFVHSVPFCFVFSCFSGRKKRESWDLLQKRKFLFRVRARYAGRCAYLCSEKAWREQRSA